MRLVENTKIVMRDPMVASAALTSDTKGVNMSKYNKCRIMLFVTTTGAGADGTVTLKQGTSMSAVNTALAFTEYWHCDAISSDTVDLDALTLVTAATLTTAGAASATSVYIFEVRADMLDTDTVGSENVCIRLDLAGAIANATHTALVYELYEPRYALGAEDMPSVNT